MPVAVERGAGHPVQLTMRRGGRYSSRRRKAAMQMSATDACRDARARATADIRIHGNHIA
jgi:hypothetical protein